MDGVLATSSSALAGPQPSAYQSHTPQAPLRKASATPGHVVLRAYRSSRAQHRFPRSRETAFHPKHPRRTSNNLFPPSFPLRRPRPHARSNTRRQTHVTALAVRRATIRSRAPPAARETGGESKVVASVFCFSFLFGFLYTRLLVAGRAVAHAERGR